MTSMQKTIAYSAIAVGLLAIFLAFTSSIHIAFRLLTSSGLTKILYHFHVNSKETKTLEWQHCKPTESLSPESNFEEGKWKLLKKLNYSVGNNWIN